MIDQEKTFKIKAVAEKTGLSDYTLRYYEQEGLVVPKRSTRNVRLYSQDDVNWLLFIDHMRHTDMSIANLKHFVQLRRYGSDYEEEILHILLDHQKTVKKKLLKYQENFDLVTRKINLYTNQLKDKDFNLYQYFLAQQKKTI